MDLWYIAYNKNPNNNNNNNNNCPPALAAFAHPTVLTLSTPPHNVGHTFLSAGVQQPPGRQLRLHKHGWHPVQRLRKCVSLSERPCCCRECLFTAAPRSILVCAYVLQWNGGLFIHNVTEAYYYQVNSFPDWAVEMHSASNATKHWDYTIRIYDQNNVYNNNGQQKCALDAAGTCVQRPRFPPIGTCGAVVDMFAVWLQVLQHVHLHNPGQCLVHKLRHLPSNARVRDSEPMSTP